MSDSRTASKRLARWLALAAALFIVFCYWATDKCVEPLPTDEVARCDTFTFKGSVR